MKPVGLCVVVLAACQLLTTNANADHAVPRPFLGPDGLPLDVPFAGAFQRDETIQSSVYGFGAPQHLLVGWRWDISDDDHPWESDDYLVQFVENGHIGPNATFWVYQASEINLVNVRNDGRIFLFDTSTANVIEGIPGNSRLYAHGSSSIIIQEGGLAAFVEAHDFSRVAIDQGTISAALYAFDRSTIVMDGGTGNNVFAAGGFIDITNGTLMGTMSAQIGGEAVLTHTSVRSLHTNDDLVDGRFGGSIHMTNGVVAEGVSAISSGLRGAGQIALSTVVVGGDVDIRGGTVGNGTTHVFADNSTILGNVLANGSSVFAMTSGEVVGGLTALGDSAAFINDGAVLRRDATLADRAQLTIQGGRVAGEVRALGSNSIAVFDGAIDGNLVLFREAGLFIRGGNIAKVNAFGESRIEMTGGTILGSFGALESTVAIITGGTIQESVIATGHSTITLAGASVQDSVVASSVGTVNLLAGVVHGNLVGFTRGTIFMGGGHVDGFPIFRDESSFFWSGGTIGFHGNPPPDGSVQSLIAGMGSGGVCDPSDEDCEPPLIGITALAQSRVFITGYDLQSTLIDPNYEGFYSLYQITGRLADGTPINGGQLLVQNSSGASFELLEAPVPEPVSMMLIVQAAVLGGMTRSLRRRRGRNRSA